MSDERFFTVEEVAERLKLSRIVVQETFGNKPGIVHIGKLMYIPASTLANVYPDISLRQIGDISRDFADPRHARVLEHHYSPKEIAEIWNVTVETIRRLFAKEEGVLRFGRNESRYKRGYKTMRIPLSVMIRVHQKLSNPR